MVRVRYAGLIDPKREFDELRPFRNQLTALKMRCRPSGPDYLALHEVTQALDRAAEHFTKDSRFYAAGAHRSLG